VIFVAICDLGEQPQKKNLRSPAAPLLGCCHIDIDIIVLVQLVVTYKSIDGSVLPAAVAHTLCVGSNVHFQVGLSPKAFSIAARTKGQEAESDDTSS
jgi:hypothetical protein